MLTDAIRRASPIIERTQNRSSRAILREGTVVIRLARNLPLDEEKRHIDVLFRRMTKAVLREESKSIIDPFRSVIHGSSDRLTFSSCTGHECTIAVQSGSRTSARRSGEGWIIERSPVITPTAFNRFLWRVVSLSMHAAIETYVHEINDRTLRVNINAVKLRFAKTNWGSCSRSGVVAISTPLLCTSKDALEYVIIHELVHVLHMNHSAEFWSCVATWCPDYEARIGKLRQVRVA